MTGGTGGAPSAQGGQPTATGGISATGGATTGGTPSTGGLPNTGGASTTGGSTSTTGGTPSTGGVPNTTAGTGATTPGGTSSTLGGNANGGKAGGASGGTTNGTGGTSGGGANGGKSGTAGAMGNAGAGGGTTTTTKFSFFVTSLGAMRTLSKSENGFGGDLRFGEATGLAGADKICRTIAETALPGAGQKEWRAFLSTVGNIGGNGVPGVDAIDRIGEGPWYDRLGRLVAANKTDILNVRPRGADPAIINDLPNENGIPNHTDGAPGCVGNACPDNHDVLTGTGPNGKAYSTNPSNTCNDWTNAAATAPTSATGGMGGRNNGPWCGHSWPRQISGENWMSALAEGGCGPGVNLAETGGPMQGVYTVGTGGGYGGIYCFALTP